MTPSPAAEIMAVTALATLLALVGLLSLAAALTSRGARGPALVLAWALLQHSANELTASGALRAAVGQGQLWSWIALVTGYGIAVPWALLLEQMLGRGWRSTIRWTWRAFAIAAIASIAFDAAVGRPGAAAPASRLIIAAGAGVALLNLWPGVLRLPRDLLPVRVGYFLFMAQVIHDYSVNAGLVPWQRGTGPLGLLVFIGSLAYTVVSRTLRGRRELQAIEQELDTARRIQASILPARAPQLAGASIAFRYVPAASVAGDVFDFLDPRAGATGILVADVCGHGVPAALIASMVKVATAAQKPHAEDPARVLAGIHLAIAGELPPAHFVTAVYVYVDVARGLVRHASAGHPPGLLYRGSDGAVTPLGPAGPLLISFAPATYPVVETPFTPGDRIVLYTDGLVEAMRADDEMFGVERLSTLVRQSDVDPDALLSRVFGAAAAFTGRPGFDDDCTLIAVENGRRQEQGRRGDASEEQGRKETHHRSKE